jgi:dGTP triphosphohydrolase
MSIATEFERREIYSPGFSHNEQGLRVVGVLENNGEGLNLTYNSAMFEKKNQ